MDMDSSILLHFDPSDLGSLILIQITPKQHTLSFNAELCFRFGRISVIKIKRAISLVNEIGIFELISVMKNKLSIENDVVSKQFIEY